MSFDLYKSVRKAMQGQLPQSLGPGPRTLLIVLADYFDESRGAAWPSERRLAHELGAGRRSVIRYLHQLQKLKIVRVVEKSHQHATTRWGINESVLERFSQRGHFGTSERPPQRRQFGTSEVLPGVPNCPSRGANLAPDLLIDPLKRDLGNQQDLDPSDRTGIWEIRRKSSAARVFPENTKNENRHRQRASASHAPTDAGNYAVVLKLAHLAYDELGDAAAAGTISDRLKGWCSRQQIQYDGWLIQKALTSAQVQRRRNGDSA